MSCALAWSGGKDSTLALDRAWRQGLPVRFLFNTYDGRTDRVRFHGVRRELIAAQARALGLDVIQIPTYPDRFESAFLSGLDTLARRGVDTVLFGNVHLADVRAWYEERTTARGFRHREPLWGEPPEALVREFIERGHRAVVVSVDLAAAPRDWLGRSLDEALLDEILTAGTVDPCGERGEYHSFSFGGPLFDPQLEIRHGVVREEESHVLLDLTLRADV